MNYKGIKDKKYNCLNCNAEILFKSYSGNYHKFCSPQCSGEFRIKQTLDRFKRGVLKNRNIIHRILSEISNKCSVCGISDWNGKPLRLWVDHIDGNASNNKPENFRLICPNCDSQSLTFSNRNKGKGRRSLGLKPYE